MTIIEHADGTKFQKNHIAIYSRITFSQYKCKMEYFIIYDSPYKQSLFGRL